MTTSIIIRDPNTDPVHYEVRSVAVERHWPDGRTTIVCTMAGQCDPPLVIALDCTASDAEFIRSAFYSMRRTPGTTE